LEDKQILKPEVAAELEYQGFEPVAGEGLHCQRVLEGRVITGVVRASDERVLINKDELVLGPLTKPALRVDAGTLNILDCIPEGMSPVDRAYKKAVVPRHSRELRKPRSLRLAIDVCEHAVVDHQIEGRVGERERRRDTDLQESSGGGEAAQPFD
jgi:hypothetical protein